MSQLTLEEVEMNDDPKFRNYSSAIDKALKTFEYTSEWADLIAALGKLNKVLQGNSKYNIIPRKVIIAKRLAQCLHPALPSGVHLKALETYDLIFKLIGPGKLASELFIFSAGLYPLLAHAAINVRPVLLKLYEIHLVPIIEFLKPGLSGLLSGVLPGLEEGSDHFDLTVMLLNKICEGISPSMFYGSLWKCMAENSQVRLPSFIYVLSRFDRKKSVDAQLEILGDNLDVMIYSLCSSLEDMNVLVQRNALEFLLAAFPLHGSHLLKSDLTRLLTSSVTTLLRRDMSLNRRLFSWILGNEQQNQTVDDIVSYTATPSDSQSKVDPTESDNYFLRHSKNVLIEAVYALLESSYLSKPYDMRAFKVLTFLLEKPEVGPAILDEILVDIFRSLYIINASSSKGSSKSPEYEELVKVTNLLYNILEESYIWSYIGRVLQNSAQIDAEGSEVQQVGVGAPTFQEMTKLTSFLLEILPVESNKGMQIQLLPCLLSELSRLLCESQSSMSYLALLTGLELCLLLLKKTVPSHETGDISYVNSNLPFQSSETSEVTAIGNSTAVVSAQKQRKYLESATNEIQMLFVKLISNGIRIECLSALNDTAQHFAFNSSPNSANFLEKMLDTFLKKDENDGAPTSDERSPKNEDPSYAFAHSIRYIQGQDFEQLILSLKLCCLMLKELSNFPIHSSDGALRNGVDYDQTWSNLPKWLQLLCTACCYLPEEKTSAFLQLHITTASTLLDLTASTLSLLPANFWQSQHFQAITDHAPMLEEVSYSSDVVSIVLLPIITPTHLVTLFKSTKVYHLLAKQLWEGLGSAVSTQQQYAELLHQLHTMAPACISYVTEDVILKDLSNEFQHSDRNSDALIKFSVLWHTGRNLDPAKWGCRRLRTFDRCLFLMFDWLSSETPSVSKSASERWLVQNFLRNDLSRLFDPLFMMLLKPHSARISIRHAVFEENSQTNSNDQNLGRNCEDAVHAISSVDGHVVYHVSASRIKRRPFNRAVMTLGLSSEGRAPESYVDRKLAFPWQVPEQYLADQTMELFVNPFPDEHLSETDKAAGVSESLVNAENLSKENESVVIVKSLLNELIDSVVNKAIASAAAARSKRKGTLTQEKMPSLPNAHSHILLYCQVSDANQTLYVLKILRHLLLMQPRLMLVNLASTGLASNRSPHSDLIIELLARHRKCLSGKGFHGEISSDWIASHRNSMYLEALISMLLSLQRSFYSNMGLSSLTRCEIVSNRQAQLAAVDLLTLILTELLPLVRDLGKGFASFVSDLLLRCRVQKIALQCTVSVLQIVTADKGKMWKENDNNAQYAIIHDIFSFNEGGDELENTYSEASLGSLIKQLFSVLALEDQIWKLKPLVDLPEESAYKCESERYQRGLPLHAQPLLTTVIYTALKQKNVYWIHTEFSRFLVSGLPMMGRSLPRLLGLVVPQICLNLESARTHEQEVARADYLLSELDALTALCHYAVSDCISGLFSLTNTAGILGGTICGSWVASGTGHPSSSLLHNLVQSLTPDSNASKNGASDTDPLSLSRKQILSSLPKILSCARYLWQMSGTEQSKLLRQKLLELLTPIGQLHGANLLSAVSLVWVEKTNSSRNHKIIRKVVPEPTQEQSALVDLIGSVKVLVPDTVVQLLRQVLKQPIQARSWRHETSLLHFFYCYLSKVSKQQLGECWNSFLQLLRDLSSMAPPLLFTGLVIFEEALQRYQTPGERKDQRELQEVATKLLEACGSLAAACLEQTTWLRRNLSVKRETLAVTTPVEEDEAANDTDLSVFTALNDGASESALPLSRTSLYSVQALIVLAELLAPLQDLVFPSQDKERVIPLLSSLLANVIPYLKHHSHSNIYGMRAAAELVSSLSNYPATRRAWRKDTFDLLFDHQFFAIDAEALRHWRNIIDNLMSHDKDAFREFLNRVSASPSGLFSSRDQEVENRTMLLKRLAFVLFATEGDQYQRYLPDILEKLSETLRLYQTWPALQAQVFVCFRVLLLRLSHHHVTSLWPSVIAETVQVLCLLENELRCDLSENSSQARRNSSLDITNAGNGLYTNGYQSWLQLFLSACKLVHLVLTLPASRLQQFQMYRWAFFGDEHPLVDSSDIRASSQSTPTFIPYLTRIYSLLKNEAETAEQLSTQEPIIIPTIGNIKNLKDLLPLFQAMERRDLRNVPEEDIIVQSMEKLLELDFLEPIPP